MTVLRVAGAQLDLVVGDLSGNEAAILEAMRWAEEAGAHVLLLPELAVTGYPPEDLVLRPGFIDANRKVVDRLAAVSGETTTVVGFVDRQEGAGRHAADSVPRNVANAAAVLCRGRLRGVYHKVLLPNYGVFDEDRYFSVGAAPDRVWDIGGVVVGISICEDIWLPDGPPSRQAAAGAKVLLNINASPFHYGKAVAREAMLADRARACGVPVVYLNLVGGQDELVFDGASVAITADGRVVARSPQFEEHRLLVDLEVDDQRVGDAVPVRPGPLAFPRIPLQPDVAELLEPEEAEVYRALTLALGDYVRKNGFTHVLIGLSGGIDSALTAAIAVDALGPESIWGVGMPSRHSSEGSVLDAKDLAARLGIRFDLVPMDQVFSAYLEVLEPLFAGSSPGVTEENLQARIRGAILMALSNKFGAMVVATGNKSEMAAGYSTLYGDMVGGYAVLKDVFKTLVYRLARWRNLQAEVIPPSSIEKPPSAELRPGQKDSDSLPPYDVLDLILAGYIEADLSVDQIVDQGIDREVVEWVTRLVDRNEYKRRQAAPGVKITTRAFGKERRMPITNRYRGG
ncbi:MAG TPA: NAD+ synthase [Acidimicrobiia bacterium]|jgi:NAD+ synthase (glutamine-hydrolysing)|nr:NAD+ synthase [Acidimicrobiia bacterium]